MGDNCGVNSPKYVQELVQEGTCLKKHMLLYSQDTFLSVKEMTIYMCVPDVLVTDTFLTVKEMHDLDVCA